MLVREFRRFRETVKAIFPDRQVFVRTDGTVKFITFKTGTQVSLACLMFIVAGWVGLTTGNFLLKDKIVAAKDARIQRLASEYDGLNDEMLKMQQGVVASVDDLKNRQELLDSLIEKNDRLAKEISSHPDLGAKTAPAASAESQPSEVVLQNQASVQTNASAPDVTAPDAGADSDADADTNASDDSAPKQTAAPSPQSSAYPGDQWWQFAANSTEIPTTITRAPKPGDPRWRRYVDENVTRLRASQDQVAAKLMAKIHQEYAELEGVVDETGLTPDRLLAALDGPVAGSGGPEVGLKFPNPIGSAAAASIDENADEDFATVVEAVSRLDGLRESLQSMPLAKPVTDYYISSPFGKRRDPFSGNWAYHSGVDMAGYWKEPVHATVPGKVTFVGRHGPYGNMVEIDHGNGFKTRYGHLYSTAVKQGQEVSRGDVVGLMGNTGRSTGTHLHYEIWFNGKLQNPLKFFRAASNAIQE
jgi:murein DD-endopeptidase MepM/ murein hydrolase activator NlpD